MYSPSAYSVYSHQQIQDPYISTDPYTVDSTTCYDLPRPSLSDNMHTVDTTGIIGNTISTGSSSPKSFIYPLQSVLFIFFCICLLCFLIFICWEMQMSLKLRWDLPQDFVKINLQRSNSFEYYSFLLQYKIKQNH